MKPLRALLSLALVATTLGPACSDGFPSPTGRHRLDISFAEGTKLGSRSKPLPLVVNAPLSFTVTVEAKRLDGTVDTEFEGFVRVGAKPGAVQSISGPGAEGRSVLLTAGRSAPVTVSVVGAYGETFLIATDAGYVPGDPASTPRPQCSNGIDDDGDGFVDFPADNGCAFANDNSETGGSFTEGASPPIHFTLPRIADIRGIATGGGAVAYPKDQLQVNTGYDAARIEQGKSPFLHDVVVTRIAPDGFYVTDIDDTRCPDTDPATPLELRVKEGCLHSIFSFNFNAPPGMRVCDRLKSFGGTATEFFGFPQIAFPTWTLEPWDPKQRECLVPEPKVLTQERDSKSAVVELSLDQALDTRRLQLVSGDLVRVATYTIKSKEGAVTRTIDLHVSKHFGPGDVPKKKDREGKEVFSPTDDASNCDLNRDGLVDFATEPEASCSSACTADPECTEWSNFAARSSFRLTLTDDTGRSRAVQADASQYPQFKPSENRGRKLRAFSGTLHYFSGGSQFTIEARCPDDIVEDLRAEPKPSARACVSPRTENENEPQ